MTTKFYEYVGVRLPILALTPKDSDMARETEGKRLGTVIDPRDADGIAAWIANQVHQLEANGPTPRPERGRVMQFSRAAATSSLATCLNQLIPAKQGRRTRGSKSCRVLQDELC